MRLVAVAVAVAVASLLSGCASITAATTLSPANPDPKEGVWVFIDSNDSSKRGVYRCKENGGKPVCIKADW